MKMLKRFTDVILIILLVALIVVVTYAIYNLKNEGFKCLSSPLTYGAVSMEKDYGEMSCYCSNGINFNNNSVFLKRFLPRG